MTNVVVDRLRASGAFTHIKPYDGRADINYVLSGRLDKLEKIGCAGGVKVEVALSAEVVELPPVPQSGQMSCPTSGRWTSVMCRLWFQKMSGAMERAIENC